MTLKSTSATPQAKSRRQTTRQRKSVKYSAGLFKKCPLRWTGFRVSPLISQEDRAGIDRFKATLQEKQDELAGLKGFERVPDAQLNAFSDYVVQDMEQAADRTITISLVTALLIVILIILLVK